MGVWSIVTPHLQILPKNYFIRFKFHQRDCIIKKQCFNFYRIELKGNENE